VDQGEHARQDGVERGSTKRRGGGGVRRRRLDGSVRGGGEALVAGNEVPSVLHQEDELAAALRPNPVGSWELGEPEYTGDRAERGGARTTG
jgi:hypothetical protein